MGKTSKECIQIMYDVLDRNVFYYLMEQLAGSQPKFPKDWQNWDKHERNRVIKKRYYDGETVKELATEYSLTESAVYEILRKR